MRFVLVAGHGALAGALCLSGLRRWLQWQPHRPHEQRLDDLDLGVLGSQSFSPNPASPGVHQMVMWRNDNAVTRRSIIVARR